MDVFYYIGSVPEFKYFKNINYQDYLEYKNQFINKQWNFKEESIKYCFIDCISLYEILINFNQLIFNRFNINIHNYPTLPSLSFANFRCNYLEENKVAGIFGQVYQDIKKAYTGGSVDMYIPFNNTNELIYGCDVNSLYPSVMQNQDMPVGKPTYFEGDILNIEPDAFGFF